MLSVMKFIVPCNGRVLHHRSSPTGDEGRARRTWSSARTCSPARVHLACLKEHQSEVSPQCAGSLKQVQQAVKQVSAAASPTSSGSAGTLPSARAGSGCLKQHSSDSPDCRVRGGEGEGGSLEGKVELPPGQQLRGHHLPSGHRSGRSRSRSRGSSRF